MTDKRTKVFLAIIALAAVVGAVASVYSILAHYDVAASDFCSVSDTFDCDIVNKSRWSTVAGIPVGVFGLISNLFFFIASLVYLRQPYEGLLNLMVFASVTALLFSLYLTYIEAFVLYTWCLICLTSLSAVIFENIGVFGVKWAQNRHKPTIQELHE